MSKTGKNRSKNPTLNNSRIEFIIENVKKNKAFEKNLNYIYTVEKLGFYLTKSNMNKSSKATLATFSRMKSKYKYVYESTGSLYEYKYNYSNNRYFFSEVENETDNWIFSDYELLSNENIIELNPTWFNTDELMVCLNEMVGNGLKDKYYEFLKENIKNYNFEKNYWKIPQKVLSQLEMRYIFKNSFFSPYKFNYILDESNVYKKTKCTDGLFRFQINRLKRYNEYKKLVNEYKSTFNKTIYESGSASTIATRKRLKTFLSHIEKPGYIYKQLTPYSKEYKVLFNLFIKQYSKWQTQQIMKYYLSIINKMTKPLEDNPVEFDENYDLGNDGFGYHKSKIKTSMDDDEIVIEMRDEANWIEEQGNIDDIQLEERAYETCNNCGNQKYLYEDCTKCFSSDFEICESCGNEKKKNEDCEYCLEYDLIENGKNELRDSLNNLIIDFYGINYDKVYEQSKNTKYEFEVDIFQYLVIKNDNKPTASIDFYEKNYNENLKDETYSDVIYAVHCFLNKEVSYDLDKYERCKLCSNKKEINKDCGCFEDIPF